MSLRRITRIIIAMFLCLSVVFITPDAGASPKKRSKARSKQTITYIVKEGDNLGKIAKKYDVRVADIARWNKIADISKIKIGQKLRLRIPKGSVAQSSSNSKSSPKTDYYTHNVNYVVKKGDTLGKIAHKTGVSMSDLKKNNRTLRKNPDRLRVGQVIVLRVEKIYAAKGGQSRGLANNGALINGIQLPKGRGYVRHKPKYSYGTSQTINLIMETMEAYADKYPKGPQYAIGDLSAKNGGKLRPHLSHQSGRDADISYINKKDKNFVGFTRMNKTNFDAEKNWFTLSHLVRTKKVQYIFVDYELQKLLYDEARKQGYSKEQLKPIIQYPNGKKSYHAIIRHAKGHVNHFHVRFTCASTDIHCR